jgi:hypothetical protein
MCGTLVGEAIILMVYLRKPKKENDIIRVIPFLFCIFVSLVGFGGFLAAGISSIGGLNWLPSSFEWPIGHIDNAAKTREGFYVVPHPYSGRIQIYDNNLAFLKGWHIGGGGGSFTASVSENNLINVYTVRGDWHYVFNLQGNLISKKSYNGKDYPSLHLGSISLDVPTNIFFLVFTQADISLFFAFFGLFMMFVLYEFKKLALNVD